MTYQPLDKLDKDRLPDVAQDLARADVIVDTYDEARVTRKSVSQAQEHMADVTVAMLYMPCGGRSKN